MGFKLGVVGLALMCGCTPAQRRAAGGATAVVGLSTSAVGLVLIDPCLLESEERREARDPYGPSCRESSEPRYVVSGTQVLLWGLTILAVGGTLYLSGAELTRRQPRPWHFKSQQD
jgi:hypothetical protein